MSLFSTLLSNRAIKNSGSTLADLAGMSRYERYNTFLRPSNLAKEPISALKRSAYQMKNNVGKFFANNGENLGSAWAIRENGKNMVRGTGGFLGSWAYQNRSYGPVQDYNKMKRYAQESTRLSEIAADPIKLAQHKAEISAMNNVVPLAKQSYLEPTAILPSIKKVG